MRGATILGGAFLVFLLSCLIWRRPLISSGFQALYFAAYAVAIVITVVQWMFNASLSKDAREAEGRYAEAVRSQTLLEEQTGELAAANAQLQKRALQLQTAVLVTQSVASMLDPEDLVQQAVSLIRERFSLYYVALFLTDESTQWAVLRAGTGDAGDEMLAQGYRLEVGDTSPVGWCVASAQVRIAPDLSAASTGIQIEVNPLLPETRSEMVLPLRARGRVIGALDVHSTEREAFWEEDIAVLQAVANQIAVTIDNARLFAGMRERLEEIGEAQSRQVREQWADFLSVQAVPGYERTQPGIEPLDYALMSEDGGKLRQAVERAMAQQEVVVQSGTDDGSEQAALVLPISLRDESLGALGLHETTGERRWTDDEIALIGAVADQMALAIENARLLAETRRRAERERLAADISARVRASTEVDTILRTAIQELGRALRASDGLIRLGTDDEAGSSQLDKVDRLHPAGNVHPQGVQHLGESE
jgi:GAF domain-containing protein